MPSDFELVGQKKGFQRFSNPELKRLVAMLEEAQRQREMRLTAALQVRQSFLRLNVSRVLDSFLPCAQRLVQHTCGRPG